MPAHCKQSGMHSCIERFRRHTPVADVDAGQRRSRSSGHPRALHALVPPRVTSQHDAIAVARHLDANRLAQPPVLVAGDNPRQPDRLPQRQMTEQCRIAPTDAPATILRSPQRNGQHEALPLVRSRRRRHGLPDPSPSPANTRRMSPPMRPICRPIPTIGVRKPAACPARSAPSRRAACTGQNGKAALRRPFVLAIPAAGGRNHAFGAQEGTRTPTTCVATTSR